MLYKPCEICKTPFPLYKSQLGKRKTCSKSCSGKLKTGNKNPFFGKKHTSETKKKTSDAKVGKTGKLSNRWLGDKAGYTALHLWINKILGKPSTCEHCGRTGLSGRAIHWANKSGEYKRNPKDWLRLCTFCHREHDKKNNLDASLIWIFKETYYTERRVLA